LCFLKNLNDFRWSRRWINRKVLNLSLCFSGFVWEKGMLRRAVCVVPHVCSVNDGKGGRCSVGDSASMPADAAVAEKKRPMSLNNAAPSAPPFHFVVALR
jgi:hypothetical protein